MNFRRYLIPIYLVVLGGCATTTELSPEGRTQAARVNAELGINYMRQERLQLALTKLNKALEFDNNFSPAHNAVAVLYERLGEPEMAEKHYRRAVEIDPADADALNNYARYLCLHNRAQDADAYFVRATKVLTFATPEVVLTNAGNCALTLPDLEKAEDYFRRALRANRFFAQALYAMAKLSYEKKIYLSARAYLQRYLEQARHTAQTLWLGILVEEQLGDADAVASYALNLRANFPDSEEARMLMERTGR